MSSVRSDHYQDLVPPTVSTVDEDVDDRDRWVQLVDVNPQMSEIALGREVEVNWTSTDGRTVGGVLVYPVGYEEGRLIHGGPASADVLRFNGGYGAQAAGAGSFAILKPNYRVQLRKCRPDIVGDYFPR